MSEAMRKAAKRLVRAGGKLAMPYLAEGDLTPEQRQAFVKVFEALTALGKVVE